jgi:hypothetical protein
MKRLSQNNAFLVKEAKGDLADLASRDLSVYSTAFAFIACCSNHKACRVAAIKEISADSALLLRISLHSKYADAKKAALTKLSSMIDSIEDDSVLFEIARQADSSQLRLSVISKLEDETLLAKLVKSTRDKSARSAALKKLEENLSELQDRAAIALVSKLSSSQSVRRAAKRQLKFGANVNVKKAMEEEDEEVEEQSFSAPSFSMPSFSMPQGGFIGKIQSLFREFIGF